MLYQYIFGRSQFSRPLQNVKDMIRSNEFYHLFASVDNNDSVDGISLLYVYPSIGIGFLDYLAVHPKYQRKGIGTSLFLYTISRLKNLVYDPAGMIIEVQKENSTGKKQNPFNKDRIRFYTKNGVKKIDGLCYCVPLGHRKPKEMYLMMMPLKKIHSLSKNLLIQYVINIYSTIYQYQGSDLLENMFSKMPVSLKLIDIEIDPSQPKF